MQGQLGPNVTIGALPSWTLLFAREPEPGLDLQVSDASTGSTPSQGGKHPQKPPRLRILLLIVLLLLVAGGAYIATDPERVMTLMGQDQSAPPVVVKSRPRPPVEIRPSSPQPTTDTESPPPVPGPSAIPSPLFGEGQSVIPAANSGGLSLSQDAGGTQPGSSIKPSETLVVLDAELHDNTWVYLVRSDEGIKGWVTEKQLAAKP